MSTLPVLGFAAWSGSGKTTLLTRMLPLLKRRGVRVGVIKHAHHDFEIDYPGKDSYELRKAGAAQMLVGSRRRWALIVEQENPQEPQLVELMQRFDPGGLDLILVEGFKPDAIPKIEVHRPSLGKALLALTDPNVIAIATDAPLQHAPAVPVLDLNQPASIGDFIVQHFALAGATARGSLPRTPS